MMRAMMNESGWDVAGGEVAFANVVSCWPEREPPTPRMDEMVACRNNLRDQVVASGCRFVVLAGGIATSAWRGDLKVSDDRVRGNVYLWGKGQWIVMPVWHPAAVLRDRGKKAEVIRHLERFALMSRGGNLDMWMSGNGVCVKCGDVADEWDVDGVGFCAWHWVKYGEQWKREWAKWSNDKATVEIRGHGVDGKKRKVVVDDNHLRMELG